MYVKVRKMDGTTCMVDVSKLTKVEDLREIIQEKMEVATDSQMLLFRGKILVNGQTLYDYDINLNDIIQLMVRPPKVLTDEEKEEENLPEEKEKTPEATNEVVEDVESELYKVGDIIDAKDANETCAWFEGVITRIAKCSGDKVVAGEDGITYFVKFDQYPDDNDSKCKLEEIRPRARFTYKFDKLEEGMKVFVNHNTEMPTKRGGWYDAEIVKINAAKTKKSVIVTLHASFPVPDCKIVFADEIMRIEEPVKLEDRTSNTEKAMNTPVARKNPFKCEKCEDSEKKCKECGCTMCGTKDDPEHTLICDECDSGYCMKCLKMKDMPPEEEDWYCPDCKTQDDIVKKGEKMKASKKKAKAPAASGKSKRDWGQGMATVGRTKSCTKVDKDHMGPIPGIEVGMCWKFRMQCSEEGIHRPPVAGIAGTKEKGCPSIVLGGGYEDDVDDGDVFTYTGAGGRDLSGNKRTAEQSFDQKLDKTNAAIAINCDCPFDDVNGGTAKDWQKGKPIRVLRGFKGAKHSKYAPKDGIRYDGIYKVVKYWPQKGKSGFIVWRYEFRRDDPAPAPWTKEGKQKIEEEGYTVQFPEGYLENEKAKKEAKEKKKEEMEKNKENGTAEEKPTKGKKRKVSESDGEKENDGQEKGEKGGKSKKKKMGDSTNVKTVESPVKKKIEYKISPSLLELMENDAENKKLWDEVRSKVTANKKELTDYVEEQFLCMICQDLVFKPVTTPCQHNVCLSCIERSFKAKETKCPSCRNDLGKDYEKEINKELRTALQAFFPGYETGR